MRDQVKSGTRVNNTQTTPRAKRFPYFLRDMRKLTLSEEQTYQDIRNSHYYIIAHLSSGVKPGAVRIATTGYTDNGITCSAFENTDGTYAFVLINNNEKSKKITVSDGQRHFAYDVPGKSVTSYRWAKSK